MMWGSGSGMMDGWGGFWVGPIFMIFWLVVIVAVIAGVIWLVQSASHHGAGRSNAPSGSSALDILDERYARGEINRDEYLRKKQEMTR